MDEFLALVAIGDLISTALTVPAGFGLSTILTVGIGNNAPT